MPVMRAIFGVFFCVALFRRVRDYAHPSVKPESLAAAALGVFWVLLQIAPGLPTMPQPFNLLTFFSIACVVPVQARINRINSQVVPDHDPNNQFSSLNWVGLVVGGVLFVLAVVGSVLPPEE